MALGNDKKKIVIIGVLGVLILGIGAFQFLGGSSTPPKSASSKPTTKASIQPEGKTADPKTDLSKVVASTLPQKDPFQPGVLPDDPSKVQPPKPTEVPKPAPRNPLMRGTRRAGSDFSMPPVSPMPGLPSPTGPGGPSGPIGANNGNGGVGIQKGTPLRQPGEFSYSVNGVVLGSHPAAVFQDDNGNQRLVPVGGSVDGDSRVVSIERGKVTVQHKGKKLTLTMGGGTSVGK